MLIFVSVLPHPVFQMLENNFWVIISVVKYRIPKYYRIQRMYIK